MENFEVIPTKVKAEQFAGHNRKYEIPFKEMKGAMGYQRKLAYLENEQGVLMTIRPNDWIVLEDGKDYQLYNDLQFQEKYRKVGRSKKVCNNEVV